MAAKLSPEAIKQTRLAGGKRKAAADKGVNRDHAYTIEEAVKLIKERAKAKFDETIEVAMNLGVDPKHADQLVRGVCNLPNGSGRTARVAVFARGAKADEAKALVRMWSARRISSSRCRRARSISIAASRRRT